MKEYNKENIAAEGSDELFEHFRLVADPGQSPVRLDIFILNRIEKASRNRIQNAIRDGSILVDDKEAKPNFKVKPGMVVTLSLAKPPREDQPVVPQNIPLDIRYEDDDIMVIHKPAGMTVHPGVGTPDGTLVNGLVYYFQNHELPIKDGNFSDRPGLVHRIDKDTTGLMVIAKNQEAMTHLSKQFYDHTTERKYQALIWGEMEEEEGTITGNIARDPRNAVLRAVVDEEDGGKHAITHFKVLERLYYVSLVECQLETGRTHQIRIHFKHKGHPLFGDPRYGGDRIHKGTVFTKYKQFVVNCFKLIPRQALHAKSIGFIHPKTGEQMFFESELPEDFQSVLDKWRNYVGGRKELAEKD
ncbi:MAG: 23S rRNA pseudouridine1911/1915/1917 synthase [Saprospiraceae bacterium]|jgi:23S rRNA pseudouridine1911/1915/1917 synthase